MMDTILIADLDLSLRLRNSLRRAGYKFLSDLFNLNIEEIKKINGLGVIGKNELIEFIELMHSGQIRIFDTKFTNERKNTNVTVCAAEELSLVDYESNPRFSVENLAISVRLKNALVSVGVKDIRETFSWSEMQLLSIPNFGKQTLGELAAFRNQFSASSKASNENHRSNIHKNAILRFPKFENEIQNNLVDCTYQAYLEFLSILSKKKAEVLRKRVCFGIEDDQFSLEEIAGELGCTRERVRQIEKQALDSMIKFFCYQGIIKSEDRLNFFQLNNQLSTYWLNLVEAFEKVDEPSIEEFISIILQCWNIQAQHLKNALPFFITIFTRSTSQGLIKELQHLNLSHFDFIKISEKVGHIKLKKLRLGKDCKSLEEEGILTISDFDKLWSSPQRGKAYKNAEGLIAEFLTMACSSNNNIDWPMYFESCNIKYCQEKESFNLEDPCSTLVNSLRTIIPYVTNWKFCVEIFDRRIVPSDETRSTMAKVSKELWGKDTLGPSVARIELYTLQKLHDVLVQRDFSFCPIYIQQELLDFFKKSYVLYEISEGDFAKFELLFKNEFPQKSVQFREFPQIVYSIINCKAADRRKLNSGNRKQNYLYPKITTAIRIKLAGFRSIC